MPAADAIRWNERYRKGALARLSVPRPFVLAHAHLLPAAGLALDVAMGTGANAAFLISRGLQVVGVDIADVAVREAKRRHPRLMAVIGDLSEMRFPSASFDLILTTFFVDRALWPRYTEWLKPGGMVMYESPALAMHEHNPNFNPEYLIKPDELGAAFAGWRVLVDKETTRSHEDGRVEITHGFIAVKP